MTTTAFQDRFESVAAPRFLDRFGERDDAGGYVPAAITLPRAQTPFEWPRVIVGQIAVRSIESTSGWVEQRESCTIEGLTSELQTGETPLPDLTQVVVERYGAEPFQIFPDECQYGGVMTRLSLVRLPLTNMANFNRSRGA